MSNPPKRPRQNRTITVDFNDETTYHQLCGNGPGFVDFVVAFILSIGTTAETIRRTGDTSGGRGEWGASAEMDTAEKGRMARPVCGCQYSPDNHAGRSDSQCDRPKTVHDERVPSRTRKPASFPQWLSDLGEPDSVSKAGD